MEKSTVTLIERVPLGTVPVADFWTMPVVLLRSAANTGPITELPSEPPEPFR